MNKFLILKTKLTPPLEGGEGGGFRSYISIFKRLFCTFYSLFTIPFYGMIFDNFTATNLYTK